MKNEEYQKQYNYGYKIGVYQSSSNMCIEILKYIFPKEHIKYKKKIKWLSNYELKLLSDKMFEHIKYESRDSNEDRDIVTKKIKIEILKLLR